MNIRKLSCGLILLALGAQAIAAEKASTGTITRMDAVASAGNAPGNADTRVQLSGVTSFCAGAADPTWAFINANDANYKGVLATLLLAYGTGKTLTINAIPALVGSATYCQITWINVVG